MSYRARGNWKMISVVRQTVSLLPANLADVFISFVSFLVFAFLDLLDELLCPVFAFVDRLVDESTAAPCYCHQVPQSDQTLDNKKETRIGNRLQLVLDTEANVVADCDFWSGPSNTLFGRKYKQGRNRVHFLALHRSLSAETIELAKRANGSSRHGSYRERRNNPLRRVISDAVVPKSKTGGVCSEESDCSGTAVSVPNCVPGAKSIIPAKARWSDCSCSTCSSWQINRDLLHVHVDGTTNILTGGDFDRADNNVIFVHGFLSSSSFWADTVLPQLPETIRASYRLFAVDLLGFGKSPKPTSCLYTHADHIDMIRRSVIEHYGIRKFHVVAHSMGCTVALSLAGHEPSAVQSVTLISPPYFLATPGTLPAEHTMRQVAPKKIWPVVAFGASVMSWYEHLGRAVCLVICKHHHIWEPLAAFVSNNLLGLRIPRSIFHDFMQHTHHSAWHIFHNTFCSSAYTTEIFMRILQEQGQRVRIIHGASDAICPIQCSMDLSRCYSNVVLSVIPGAGHLTVVVGRELDLATEITQEILRAHN